MFNPTFQLLAVNMPEIFSQLTKGMGMTLTIFFLTLIISMPLALLVAFGRMAKNGILRNVTKFFISVLRGTPLMLQLMVVYFAPGYMLVALKNAGLVSISASLPDNYRFIATIIGFSINYAAYFAEIYRGGIESMPVGQYEAAEVLGFSKSQTFFRIILPQVFKVILPSVTNEIITLVKDTSLAFTISCIEMFTAAKMLASAQSSVVPFLVAGVFYYIMNYIVAFAMEFIEKKMSYYK